MTNGFLFIVFITLSILAVVMFIWNLMIIKSVRKLEDRMSDVRYWIKNNQLTHKKCSNCGRSYLLSKGEYQEICDKCYFRSIYGNTNPRNKV